METYFELLNIALCGCYIVGCQFIIFRSVPSCANIPVVLPSCFRPVCRLALKSGRAKANPSLPGRSVAHCMYLNNSL